MKTDINLHWTLTLTFAKFDSVSRTIEPNLLSQSIFNIGAFKKDQLVPSNAQKHRNSSGHGNYDANMMEVRK